MNTLNSLSKNSGAKHSVHLLVRFLHRFTNLLDHAELISALCLGAGVTHRPLNCGVRRNPT